MRQSKLGAYFTQDARQNESLWEPLVFSAMFFNAEKAKCCVQVHVHLYLLNVLCYGQEI